MKNRLFKAIEHFMTWFYYVVMWFIYKVKTGSQTKGSENISRDYKKRIKKYWKQFGYRVDIRDYKFYKTKTGVENERYMNDIVYHSRIEPYFNCVLFYKAFSDKNYFDLFFAGIKTPHTIIRNINGNLTTGDYKLISLDEAVNLCLDEDEIVLKPSIETGGGRGITFIKIKDLSDKTEILTLIKKYGKNFMIQRGIKQHEEMKNLNASSVNAVRVHSLLYKGKVIILSSYLRMGSDSSKLDNLSAGGRYVGIEEDGTFGKKAYDIHGNSYECAPNGYSFENKKLFNYEGIKETVKKLHPRFGHFGIISWDITLDECGDPVVIEFNLIDSGPQPHQLANEKAFFGDLTDEVLNDVLVKKK